MQGSEQNHGDHSAKEQDYDQRVKYGEPLDVRLGHGFENVVPSGGPLDGVVFDEGDAVRICDEKGLILGEVGRNFKRHVVATDRFGLVRMGDAGRFHLEVIIIIYCSNFTKPII